ncbi:MAG: type II restriction endonuclease [Acidithiobacillus sp.]
MTNEEFQSLLEKEVSNFKRSISTDEGQWIIKGFIDVFRKVYTITVDTKVVSKVLEILLYPKLKEFADKNELELQLPKHQNHYPDATFICKKTGVKFAVDIKSTIRKTPETVNMMTLGAFTGYFRNRQEGENSGKNITYPYNDYSGHFVFGIIYTQNKEASDEIKSFTLDELNTIPSVIHDFDFFVQPKYKIATSTPGSGNTKNIGSCTKIKQLKEGTGPFHKLGVEVFDDYWMFYLTEDMAKKDETERPYTNIITYLQYKKRFLAQIDLTPEAIAELTKEEEVDHD